MTDGVFGIGHGNTSGVGGGYVPQRRNENPENAENKAQAQVNYEETQVDPNKVMDFLAKNNYFIPVTPETTPAVNPSSVDEATQSRIAGYMESFEQIFSIVETDFPSNAEAVMDVVMDKLLGMV